MAELVTSILRRALGLVSDERPDAAAQIATCLEGVPLSFTVRGEPEFTLYSTGQVLVEGPLSGAARVRVVTDRRAVKALIAGATTLNGALRGGAVDLRGTTGDLESAHCAFEIFVGALLRIDGAESLRHELENGE